MTESELIGELKKSADSLYENHGSQTYEELPKLIPELNRQLQELVELSVDMPDAEGELLRQKVRSDLQELLTAYRCVDRLALADLLCYDISEELAVLEKLKTGGGGN